MANEAAFRHQQARDLATELRDYLRAIGAVVEPSELSGSLAGLFPEAPESIARQQAAAPAIPDPGVEIIFQAGEPLELLDSNSAEELPGLDQPDSPAMAVGSPLLTSPGGVKETDERARPAAPRGTMPAPIAESSSADGPAPASPGISSPRPVRRRALPPARSSDVDIFPEPTRTIAPLGGGDLFGGHGSRPARPIRDAGANEPAFLGARAPRTDSDPWPWARSIHRSEEPAREAAPDGEGPKKGDPGERE